MSCIFCRIIAGEIPCKKVYEDENVLAFDDIQPLAKVHTLIVPKAHVENPGMLDDDRVWSAILNSVKQVVEIKGISETGYRLAINSGPDGTQIVPHLHVHILGGQLLDSKLG